MLTHTPCISITHVHGSRIYLLSLSRANDLQGWICTWDRQTGWTGLLLLVLLLLSFFPLAITLRCVKILDRNCNVIRTQKVTRVPTAIDIKNAIQARRETFVCDQLPTNFNIHVNFCARQYRKTWLQTWPHRPNFLPPPACKLWRPKITNKDYTDICMCVFLISR